MSRIISVKRVANNGLQVEIVDKVQTRKNVLQLLNKGDERFDVTKERHAWFPATVDSLEEIGFSADDLAKIEKLEMGTKIECNYENPKIDGDLLRIQVAESTIPNSYQKENALKAAKQLVISAQVAKSRGFSPDMIGKTAYFLAPDGAHIFVNSSVALNSQLNHTTIEGATLIPAVMMSEYGAYLAESIEVTQKETV